MLSSDFRRGATLFNEGLFFEAHEVLEDAWRAAAAQEKKFLQGLIQIAVALHHHGNGNLVGARSLLGRAARNLSGYSENFGGIELKQLRYSVAQWQRALGEGTPVPPLPKVILSR